MSEEQKPLSGYQTESIISAYVAECQNVLKNIDQLLSNIASLVTCTDKSDDSKLIEIGKQLLEYKFSLKSVLICDNNLQATIAIHADELSKPFEQLGIVNNIEEKKTVIKAIEEVVRGYNNNRANLDGSDEVKEIYSILINV